MNILICYIEWFYHQEEIEYILDFEYIEPETINYEIKPGIYEL